MTDEQFIKAVLAEAKRARKSFPAPNTTNAALVEEVGEVSKALMFEPWTSVCGEAVQVAVMAMRLATEGDCTFEEWRDRTIHQDGTRYCRPEHRMPKQVKP